MKNSETLLDMSKRQYRSAKILYQAYPADDGIINDVAYHLQQCVELCIKHTLELNNINYPKQHDINELLTLLPKHSLFPFTKINAMADQITSLESDTRYIKGYRASLEIVKSVFLIAEDMLKQADNISALNPLKYEQERREDIIWQNAFNEDSPEFIFCQSYNKAYRRLGAPTSQEGYDEAVIFATRELFFRNIPQKEIVEIIDRLAPMVPYQEKNNPYSIKIINKVLNMEDIKSHQKNTYIL